MSILFSLRLALAVVLRESARLLQRVTDTASNTLILLASGRAQWTGLHMDRTEAVNVAFAVVGKHGDDIRGVLAVWIFISPTALELLETFLKNNRHKNKSLMWRIDQDPLLLVEGQRGYWFHGPPDKQGRVGRPYLTEAGVAEFQEAAAAAGHPDWVVEVLQRHGEVVCVPPGWMHQARRIAEPRWPPSRCRTT
jgi:hypothetical protein